MITSSQNNYPIFKHTNHFMKNLKPFHYSFTSLHQEIVICTVHTTSCYKLNKHLPTLTIVSFKITLIYTYHHDNPMIDFSSLTPNTSPFFLNFTYCNKNTNFQGILRNLIPSHKCIYSVHSLKLQRRRIPTTNCLARIYSTYRNTYFRIHPQH